jgi:hypothetical protein
MLVCATKDCGYKQEIDDEPNAEDDASNGGGVEVKNGAGLFAGLPPDGTKPKPKHDEVASPPSDVAP